MGPGLSKSAPNFGVGQEVLRELPGPCRSEEGCSLGVTYQPCRSLPSCWETNAGEDKSVLLSCCVPVTMCDCEAALTHSGTQHIFWFVCVCCAKLHYKNSSYFLVDLFFILFSILSLFLLLFSLLFSASFVSNHYYYSDLTVYLSILNAVLLFLNCILFALFKLHSLSKNNDIYIFHNPSKNVFGCLPLFHLISK